MMDTTRSDELRLVAINKSQAESNLSYPANLLE